MTTLPACHAEMRHDKPDQINVAFIIYPVAILLVLAGRLQAFTHARKNVGTGPRISRSVLDSALWDCWQYKAEYLC